jgi:hypothetical protein
MKNLLFALFFMTTANAFGYGSIVFPLNNNKTVEIGWLGNGVDESKVEVAWENEGHQNLFSGNVCYKGKRTEAVKVLEDLSSNDFLGDEFRIRNIRFIGTDRISYQVYDGPNRVVAQYNVIRICP